MRVVKTIGILICYLNSVKVISPADTNNRIKKKQKMAKNNLGKINNWVLVLLQLSREEKVLVLPLKFHRRGQIPKIQMGWQFQVLYRKVMRTNGPIDKNAPLLV